MSFAFLGTGIRCRCLECVEGGICGRMEHGVLRYWVEGDLLESEDSRKWGWLERDKFLKRVMLRYRKGG